MSFIAKIFGAVGFGATSGSRGALVRRLFSAQALLAPIPLASFLLAPITLVWLPGCDGSSTEKGRPMAVASMPDAFGMRLFADSARPRKVAVKSVSVGDVRRRSYLLLPGQSLDEDLPSGRGVFSCALSIVDLAGRESIRAGSAEITVERGGSAVAKQSFAAEEGKWFPAELDLAEALEGSAGEGPASLLVRFIPGPGEDHDDSGLALALAHPMVSAPPAGRPNIIVISIDTLRPDHLGYNGYERETSPALDKLALESVVFERCYSHSSWTPPSVASLFTSLYPPQHGSLGKDRVVLHPDNKVMAEMLSRAGYRTAAFSASPFIHPDFGFGQGFDVFGFDASERADKLNEMVMGYLDEMGEGPHFMYIMYFDPHFPYEPPEGYGERFRNGPDGKPLWSAGRVAPVAGLYDLGATVDRETFEWMRSMYDGEIAYADLHFGKLIEELAARGILDRSALAVTSDHGEEFLEHGGFGHGNTLYDEVLRVVLLLRPPGGAGEPVRVGRNVEQVDILPTLFELAGLAPPWDIEGESLVPLLSGGPKGSGMRADPEGPGRGRGRGEGTAYAASMHLFRDGRTMRMIAAGDKKLIVSEGPARVELYDLGRDPFEQRNIARERPELLERLTDGMLFLESELAPSPINDAGPAAPGRTRRLLESLGYTGK